MNKYKVISVDMFQTLIDVNSRRHYVFKRILGDLYDEALAEDYWEEANIILSNCIKKYIEQSDSFYSVKAVFENCYYELFSLKGIRFDPYAGARILAGEHNNSDLYEDTELFIDKVKKYYPLCLVSDTDLDMVYTFLEKFQFDKAFLSEELKCYKNSKYKSIFTEVLKSYKVKPEEILHIGDSYADIAGAKRFGITACWLNRNNQEWKHEIQPDYTVSTLIEAEKLLEIDS
jgi:putative hydrolase of the HAD superfamily